VRWYRWLLRNVAIFALVGVLFSYAASALEVLLGTRLDATALATAPVTFFVFLGPLYLPGLAVYLFAVRMIPRPWDPRSRRIAAIVTSAVIGGLIWMIGIFGAAFGAVALYALVFPLCYGAVVRLPERAPAEEAEEPASPRRP
jgi:hypothetical protein